jgi:hypothetical protein
MKMNKGSFLLFFAAFLFCIPAAEAGQDSWLGHDGVSIASAVSITETSPIKFGNFTVTSPGDVNASIVLDDNGNRTVHNGGTTTITLLNGGVSDLGSQSPGSYHVMGASAGTNIYVTFTDHTGTAISSGNQIVLIGPVGSSNFLVDTLTFNQSGSDGTGPYRTTDGSGNANILVGATLHTQSGATTYAPGRYTGTFEVMISY